MLKIGEFSKLSRISVRMLRYYDEIGLLHPAQTDRETDYRYYCEGMVWGVLCGETDAMKLVPDDPCYCSVTFLDAEWKEHNVEIKAQNPEEFVTEVGIPVCSS